MLQLHLGVNSGAARFAIERLAANEATFRCSDELGWQPQVSYDLASCLSFIDEIGKKLQGFLVWFEEYHVWHYLNSFFFVFRFSFAASTNSP